MVTMGIEHYNQPHAVFFILEVSNAFFTTVFGLGKSLHQINVSTEYSRDEVSHASISFGFGPCLLTVILKSV